MFRLKEAMADFICKDTTVFYHFAIISFGIIPARKVNVNRVNLKRGQNIKLQR